MMNDTFGNSSVQGEDSGDECSDDQKLISTLPVQLGFSLLYAVIFSLGFFGNLLVSMVVIRNPAMHTVTNFFILNLAMSDIVMCLFAVPFTPLQSFTGRWLFGDVLCTLFPFSQGVSVYISTLTLTIIAVDRFVVIIYPFRARMQIKTSLLLIFIIDLMAALFTTPYAIHVEIVEGSDGQERCNETWDGLKRTIYGAFTNITQFVLPFVTIILCYTAIIRRLEQRSAHRPGARSSAHREEMERIRNQRTNRMLISMVVAFGICWLPLNTINFIADLDLFPIYCWHYHHFIFFVCHVMAMSSTCYNPFLYGLHNEAFQKGFVELVPFLRIICGSASVEKHQNNDVAMAQIVQKANGDCVVVESDAQSKFTHINGSPGGRKQDQETLSNKTVHLVVSSQSSQTNLRVTTVIDKGLNPESGDSQV